MTDTTTLPFEWTDLPPERRLHGPPRILIVDDEEEFLELTSQLLESMGFVVECARAASVEPSSSPDETSTMS